MNDADGKDMTQPAGEQPWLKPLAPGRIRPLGWLRAQLELQARGLTGRLEDTWPDVGSNSGWRGGDGESWERGPYYLDGLIPLAHALDDPGLKAKAQPWIEWILASQRPDGQFGPSSNDDWWPRMVALKALIQHAEATGDPRVEPFIAAYARYQAATLPSRPLAKWAVARGAEALLALRWLHARTGEPFLLDLARLILSQTAPWERYLTRELIQQPATVFSHMTHVVNVAMALKQPVLRQWCEIGIDGLAVAMESLAALDHAHGQAQGMFSGDEWLAGDRPHHGVELCAVVELMFSLETLACAGGGGAIGDRLELIAFNALAATLTADMTAHQYHQQPNQVLVSIARRDWTYSSDAANTFGLEPHFGCCTANMHQGWPKFATHLWLETQAGDLVALAYAPCAVDGSALSLEIETEYPFEETIRIRITRAPESERAIVLRLPEWCGAPDVAINGTPKGVVREMGQTRLSRRWRVGDEIVLKLPMRAEAVARPEGAASVRLGPLLMAFSPGEVWRAIPDSPGLGDWEVTPRRSWNLALELAPGAPIVASVSRTPVGAIPFALAGAPVQAKVRARYLPEWELARNSAAPPPRSPVTTALPPRMITLVPYGCARLRICEFPTLDLTSWHGYDF